MPTDSLTSILWRELSVADATDIIDLVSRLLRELVNHGTNALARCSASVSGNVDEDVAPIALYRHMIEMTDGIEVSLAQACAIPAIPALRSLFEASLALEYMLENESDYTNRSLAWLVAYVHQRMDMYERLDPSTGQGAEFAAFVSNDPNFSSLNLPTPLEARNAAANLRSFLSQPHIQPIEAEYQRLGGRPNWYQFFGGPRHLRALTEHLGRGGQYEVLYRSWSRTAHAVDLLAFLHRTDQGEPAIGRLRKPDDIRGVASLAASFMLGGTQLIIRKFRSGEDLGPWYVREIQRDYLLLTGASDTA